MSDKSRLRPWFQFYASDFATATMAWDDEQVGAYIRLLSYQWINGQVPIDNHKALSRIADSAATHLDVLGPKFPGGINPRLEEIRGTMADRVEQGRKAAQVRWHGRVQDIDDSVMPEADEDADAHAAAHAPADAEAHAEGHGLAMVSRSTSISTSRSKPRANGEDSKRSKSKPVSNAMWQAFRATYPERDGTQGWAKALDKANALVDTGTDWAEIMAGARRYRDQQQAAGKIGTSYVKRAEFFLSREAQLWTEAYPVQEHGTRTQQNVGAAQRFIDRGNE